MHESFWVSPYFTMKLIFLNKQEEESFTHWPWILKNLHFQDVGLKKKKVLTLLKRKVD